MALLSNLPPIRGRLEPRPGENVVRRIDYRDRPCQILSISGRRARDELPVLLLLLSALAAIRARAARLTSQCLLSLACSPSGEARETGSLSVMGLPSPRTRIVGSRPARSRKAHNAEAGL